MQIAQPVEEPNKAYIFLYLLGNSSSVNVKSIYAFAEKEELEVVYVASQGQIDKYPKKYPSIEEWISLINSAKYIVTNSYHGAIFSILMNKQFLVLPIKGFLSEMNDRLDTLFNDCQLPYSLYSTDINSIKSKINYDEINLRLEKKRQWIKDEMKIWLAEPHNCSMFQNIKTK
jgi:exopolysaccharide biosynthesis predicted pyruvyltransferase EpsI